ncbi:prolyl oligopeptidase family serine peptidase [Rhodanobacter sp. AS-Z3]|uniref:S9 family peptidase n=1 Tax=Rhodanobacter sp. AS-Z3 TaxID=3031330 RepID=UPI0024786D98|nr:alpha/beta fold hydrolase [Rhodanobacter sp. AS-Z3]WEN14762.1 prolyl oligopeptidase family serine peptidase [Rhodanobacter sp. AS-Z3]
MNTRQWMVALGLLWVTVLHAQSVSLADLARHMEYGAVKISPDGQYVAATAMVKGHTVLALMRLADKKGQLIRPRDEDSVTNFWWVSPTRVVYAVGTRVGGYDAPLATGELYAVNADGSDPAMLYGVRKGGTNIGSLIPGVVSTRGTAEFIAAIPDDPNHILVSTRPWDAGGLDGVVATAYRMDVHTGGLRKLTDAPMRNANFVADHQGRIRFAWGEDDNGGTLVFEYPVDGSGWKAAPELSAGRSVPLAFNRDDSAAYFACPGKAGGFGICRWTDAKPELEEVWSNPNVEADGLLQGLAEGDIAGVTYMDGRASITPFDMGSHAAQVLVALMKQFPGESVQFVSGTRDGHLSVVRVEADADPGAFYLFDSKANTLTALLRRASWINPRLMAAKQPFEFAARDGMKLQGYVSYPPHHEQGKQLPTVIVVHGGPFFVRDRWDYDPDVQALATHGYAVVQVNFRGSSERGYDFEKAGSREWGGKMQDDITDATRWAIAQGIADPKRLCIYGASYGGYAALEGAVKEPELYKCAIGYVGVYDLPLMYRDGDTHESKSGKNYLKRQMGDDMAELARHSPINQLDTLKARVMLVVGDKDERVPPIQGINLHKALLTRNVAHVWMEKAGEMHGFYDEDNITELYTKMLEFIGSSIGPGVTDDGAADH